MGDVCGKIFSAGEKKRAKCQMFADEGGEIEAGSEAPLCPGVIRPAVTFVRVVVCPHVTRQPLMSSVTFKTCKRM